ncbi:MAG TPA: hypothetical protein VLX91_10975 [Candidatus Acidoferrales bacterium]|nr:hypothetical protein [Candidatus Acidoferrales bacterium]
MTLQRATQYALTGMWVYLIISLLQSVLTFWAPAFYYGNLTLFRSLWILTIIVEAVPLIIFFNALRRGQSGESGS